MCELLVTQQHPHNKTWPCPIQPPKPSKQNCGKKERYTLLSLFLWPSSRFPLVLTLTTWHGVFSGQVRSPARIVSTTDGQLSGSKIVKSLALLARFGECTESGISIGKNIADATPDWNGATHPATCVA